jgi:hypothetical protein
MSHTKTWLHASFKSLSAIFLCLIFTITACDDNPTQGPTTNISDATDTTINWGTLAIVYKDSVVTAQRVEHDLEESKLVIGRYFDSINKVKGSGFELKFKIDSAVKNYKMNYLLGIGLHFHFLKDSIATPPCRPGPRPNIIGYETIEYSGPCMEKFFPG